MAITHTIRKRTNLAALKAVFAKFTFDNAYAAGGLAPDPTKLGLTSITAVAPLACSAQGLIPVWDFDNKKLQLFYPTGSTIAAPAAIGDPIVAVGAVAVLGVNADGRFTAGRGKELAAATDASAVTVEVIVYGQ